MAEGIADQWPEPHPKISEANARLTELTGKIIREFAIVELALANCLAALLKTDPWRARIVLAGMPNMRARKDLLTALAATYLLEPDLAAFMADMDKLKHVTNKRNMLAHQAGGVDADDPRYVYFFSDSSDPESRDMAFGKQIKVQLSSLPNWGKDAHSLAESLRAWPEKLLRAATKAKMHREPPH